MKRRIEPQPIRNGLNRVRGRSEHSSGFIQAQSLEIKSG